MLNSLARPKPTENKMKTPNKKIALHKETVKNLKLKTALKAGRPLTGEC